MRTNKKVMPFLILFSILSGLIFLLPGCTIPEGPVEVLLPSDPPKTQQSNFAQIKQGSPAEQRFQESTLQGPTAVESAIELSKKYAKLSEEAALLRQKNQDFVAENRRLKDQVAVLNTQLHQTQKELTEANDLLMEMRVELNNWKVNILGFRSEMRHAEKTQLEALLKILKVLGGEVKAQETKDKDIDSTAVSQSKRTQSVPLETPILGETDE